MSQRDLKEAVHSAYVYVLSSEANQSTSAITFDHIIDQQISFLKKDETRALSDGRGRISRYDRLTQIQADLDAAIEAINNMVEV